VQSEIRIQPAQDEDAKRQKIRAKILRRETHRFRVLIIGRAKAGKTTILQRVCNTTEQPKILNRQGRKVCVMHIELHWRNIETEMRCDSNPGYVFHESCGFEGSRLVVKNFIEYQSRAKDINEHLHAIWYCIPINDGISDGTGPITRADVDFFDNCETGRVPVIVVFTKGDLPDPQTKEQLVDTGMSIEGAASRAGEESINNFDKKFRHVDCSLLVKETAAFLSDDTILQLFLSVQQDHLSLSMEYAVKRVMFDSQGQWSKKGEKQMITINNVLKYFPHIAALGLAQLVSQVSRRSFLHDADNGLLWLFLYDADNGLLWVLNRIVCFGFHSTFQSKFDQKVIQIKHDALHCVDWPSNSAYLCIATAIISGHSYLSWKQQCFNSTSSKHLKTSFDNFKSSPAVANIWNAIKELDQGDTDVATAIVKIALDNYLCKFSIFQQTSMIPSLTLILGQ
ncbi:hypothetical protein K443DRAFT_98032, partial [Laccaria amethystina LaAM-08-1]